MTAANVMVGFWRTVNALAMAILCAMAGVSAWFVTEHWNRVPPIEYHDARLVTTPPIRPGQTVMLEYLQTRNRACPSDIYGWWVNADSQTADVRLPMTHGGYSPINNEPYWQRVKLNAPAIPGTWEYRVNLISYCEGRANGTYVHVPPPIRVTVE